MKPEAIPSPPVRYRLMQAMMWPVLKLLGMTCREAFRLASDQMDAPLSGGDKLRLRLHLLRCGFCRKLPAQFANQRAWLRCCHDEDPHSETHGPALPEDARTRIRHHLHQQQKP